MAGTSFEFEGLEELAEALEKVQKACPDFALKQINAAGNHFRRDVKKRTDERTKKGKGNLIKGYKKVIVLTSISKKSYEAQVSGGNGKGRHFHLVEHGHEGFVFDRQNKVFKYIGFVEGKHMMKDTIEDWDKNQKLIPYAVKAVEEAIKKGFV